MLYRDPKLFDIHFWGGVGRIFSITGFTVVATFIMVSLFPLQLSDVGFLSLGFKLVLITSVTFSVHLALSKLFGLEEAEPIFKKLGNIRKFMFKQFRVNV